MIAQRRFNHFICKAPSLRRTIAAIIGCILLVGAATLAKAQPAYIAGTWNDNSIHILDSNLNNISSFPTGSSDPNGTAFDGTRIYSGHFTTNEVIAYNMSGVEQFRWSAPISNLQGMEMVGNQLAIYNAGGTGQIQYRNPATGALIGTVPGQSVNIEGLTYDGVNLYELDGSVIYAANPNTGAVLYTIPNPAVGHDFSGTGLAASSTSQLTVAATNGDWWKISSITGALQASGNNGLNMFGLSSLTLVPEPSTIVMAMLAGLLALPRRVIGRRAMRVE